MQADLFRTFASYDIFGKSIPGAILLAGALLLLPIDRIPIGEGYSMIELAGFVLILLLSGLMIGEGIHTLALNIEKLFLWAARRLHHGLNYLRTKFGWRLVDVTIKKSYDPTDPPRHIVRVIYNSWNGIVEWLRRRYWGTYDSLAGHRLLFAKSIKWNYTPRDLHHHSPESQRWQQGSKGILYDRFINAFKQEFDKTDIRQMVPHQIITHYPLITSSLSKESGSEFRRFQSTYSFCRSMWVVLAILSFTYADILYLNLYFQSQVVLEKAAITTIIPVDALDMLLTSILIGAVFFFDAAGTYKRHYVEYLIAEFGNVYN